MKQRNRSKKKSSHTSRRVDFTWYLIFVLSSFFIAVGIFIFNIFYQVYALKMVTVEQGDLDFTPLPIIDKWHNKEVKFAYLTFDDGPSANANNILDILDRYEIKGTFFVLGSAIDRYSGAEKVLKRMVDTDHYIGMHTMSHDYAYLYSVEDAALNFANELLEEQQLIEKITDGFKSELCRAPYGTGGGTFKDAHVEELKKIGIKCWDWDVDSLDWKAGATTDSIMENIEACMRLWNFPKTAVILFHEKDVTVEVLPQVIEYYLDLGYEFLPYDPTNHIVKNLFGSDEL